MKNFYLLLALCKIACLQMNAQSTGWTWAKTIDSKEGARGTAVARDSSGNVFVTGLFADPTIVFGADTFQLAGNTDVFVSKYNSSGQLLWTRAIQGSSAERSNSICNDEQGNIYVTGWWRDAALAIDSITLMNDGLADIFIVKMNASGELLWAKKMSSPADETAYCITADDAGCIYLSGYFGPSITYGDSTFFGNDTSGIDAFLMKCDSNGQMLWMQIVGSEHGQEGISVAVTKAGNVYFLGYHYGDTLNVNGTILRGKGLSDAFLIKYSANGQMLWVKMAGGPSMDYPIAVCTDAQENAYTTGHFKYQMVFDSIAIMNHENLSYTYDVFLAKYDANGNAAWAKALGSDFNEYSGGIASDESGYIYISGRFHSYSMEFGSKEVHSMQDTFVLIQATAGDVFLAKYDSNGDCLMATSAGGDRTDEVFSIAAGTDDVYITGCYFSDLCAFGATTLARTGTNLNPNFYLAKFNGFQTSVEEAMSNAFISISPNPTSGRFNIQLPDDASECELKIYNLMGQCLYQTKVNSSNNQIQLDAPSGLYTYQLQSKHHTQSGKIVVRD